MITRVRIFRGNVNGINNIGLESEDVLWWKEFIGIRNMSFSLWANRIHLSFIITLEMKQVYSSFIKYKKTKNIIRANFSID